MATVRDTPMSFRRLHPVNIEALGDGSFIQCCPSLGYRSLWTHVENRRYRESYLQHLALQYPGLAPAALPSTLHVDHLFSRARSRLAGLNYIRMILLPSEINTSHGAGYEKSRTMPGGTATRPRHIDTVLLMKLFGFRSPPGNGEVTPEIRRFAVKLGPLIDAQPWELEKEVAELLNYARSRRG